MENVFFSDVVSCIQIWTSIIIAILSIFAYHIWRFSREHPEIFRPDTTAEDQLTLLKKAELRRQYNNKSMIAIAVIFVWMIGMSAIMLNFESITQAWFIIAIASCAILWVMSMIRPK